MRKKIILYSIVLLSFFGLSVFASTVSNILPTSDGFYTAWTPSTGTTHYTLVDETPCNGNTDYNSTNTIGNRDSYGITVSSVPNTAQITQIDIKPCASKNSAGGSNSTMNVFYRLNGVNSSDSGAYSLSATTPAELATTSFSSLTEIKTSTTTLEVGAILSAGAKGVRLSRIGTTLTYTAFSAPSNLKATATSSSEIDLTWNDNSTFENGYVIERRNVTASTTFAVIATTSPNTNHYEDTGLTSSTQYGYKVRGFNAGGYSSYTSTAVATTTP